MVRKIESRNAMQRTYDSYGWAISNTSSLREHLEIIMKSAPGLSKRVGLTPRDILEIRRLEGKFHKIRDHIYEKQSVY